MSPRKKKLIRKIGLDMLLVVRLRMTVGEWGWDVTGADDNGHVEYLIDVGDGGDLHYLRYDVVEGVVRAHLNRGQPGKWVREQEFPGDGWRAASAAWVVAELRAAGVEPVEIGGAS